MAKRSATTPLHQENWNQESDKEEAGSFTSATNEEMRNRTVKKARRRISTPDASVMDRPNQKSRTNVLAGFTGFASSPHNSKASSNLFLFDDNTPKTILTNPTEVNGNSTTTTATSVTTKITSTLSPASVSSVSSTLFNNPSTTDTESAPTLKPATTVGDFFRRLRILNEAVVKWITMHVQQNPHCVLTPVFRDYEKYYSEMEQRFPNLISVSQPPCANTSPTSVLSVSPPKLSQRNPTSVECIRPLAQAIDALPGHFVGGKNVAGNAPPTAMETQGVDGDNAPVVVGIPSTNSIVQFKPPKMDVANMSLSMPTDSLSAPKLSFASTPFPMEMKAENESDEEEEPEIVLQEVVPVEEEGSFYSKKCKLFYKHEGTFIEKGIGMLHLKKLDDKLQLVIRADTNLGNIMLNIIVNPSFPIQRMGKNNVMICCVPNPAMTPKMESNNVPIPLLIRVASGENADELLEKLKSSTS